MQRSDRWFAVDGLGWIPWDGIQEEGYTEGDLRAASMLHFNGEKKPWLEDTDLDPTLAQFIGDFVPGGEDAGEAGSGGSGEAWWLDSSDQDQDEARRSPSAGSRRSPARRGGRQQDAVPLLNCMFGAPCTS